MIEPGTWPRFELEGRRIVAVPLKPLGLHPNRATCRSCVWHNRDDQCRDLYRHHPDYQPELSDCAALGAVYLEDTPEVVDMIVAEAVLRKLET